MNKELCIKVVKRNNFNQKYLSDKLISYLSYDIMLQWLRFVSWVTNSLARKCFRLVHCRTPIMTHWIPDCVCVLRTWLYRHS